MSYQIVCHLHWIDADIKAIQTKTFTSEQTLSYERNELV